MIRGLGILIILLMGGAANAADPRPVISEIQIQCLKLESGSARRPSDLFGPLILLVASESGRQAILKSNFIRGTDLLQNLIEDEYLHEVLRDCYPNSEEKRLRVVELLIRADVTGKIAGGVASYSTGIYLENLILPRLVKIGYSKDLLLNLERSLTMVILAIRQYQVY